MTHTKMGRVLGGDPVKRETIEEFAAWLDVPAEQVVELRRDPGRAPFRLPQDADLLSPRQRDAVRVVIDQFIADQKQIQKLSDAAGQTAQDAGAGSGESTPQPVNLAERRRKSKGSQPNPIPPSMRNRELHAAQDSDEPRGAEPAGKDDGEE